MVGGDVGAGRGRGGGGVGAGRGRGGDGGGEAPVISFGQTTPSQGEDVFYRACD